MERPCLCYTAIILTVAIAMTNVTHRISIPSHEAVDVQKCGPEPSFMANTIALNHNFKVVGPAHIFSFPNNYSKITLCVPQKNGNRNFGALLYRLYKRKVPESVDELIKWMNRKAKDMKKEVKNSRGVFFIARNPYSRVLSEYLNHVAEDCILKWQCHGRQGINIMRKSFHISNDSKWIPSFQEYVDFLSSMRSIREVCIYNHHLCPQTANSCLYTGNVAVLKLESQASWWSCFLERIGVETSMLIGSDWVPYAGRPCYYSSSGNCDNEPSEGRVIVGPVHGTNASAKIKEYYTQESALAVTKLYFSDFAVLGYPKWDGVTDFVIDV